MRKARRDIPKVWDNKAKKRFRFLAAKEALETITKKEFAELCKLDKLRERHFAHLNRQVTNVIVDACMRALDKLEEKAWR